jgi:choline kinase
MIINEKKATTALLLAAGTGSRLYPLTESEPKCLTKVHGTSILERLVKNLRRNGFKRLVIITGHLDHRIKQVLGNSQGNLKIEYHHSPLYKTTNNIYSLWMARKCMHEPFVIFESDLVFDERLLESMRFPDRIALAQRRSWMDGTCVTLTAGNRVSRFVAGDDDAPDETMYKTVNIYSLSMESWKVIVQRLDAAIAKGAVNEYYETVFSDLVDEGDLSLKRVSFDKRPWYEIDTIDDLNQAEKLFYDAPVKKSNPAAHVPVAELFKLGSVKKAVQGV